LLIDFGRNIAYGLSGLGNCWRIVCLRFPFRSRCSCPWCRTEISMSMYPRDVSHLRYLSEQRVRVRVPTWWCGMYWVQYSIQDTMREGHRKGNERRIIIGTIPSESNDGRTRGGLQAVDDTRRYWTKNRVIINPQMPGPP